MRFEAPLALGISTIFHRSALMISRGLNFREEPRGSFSNWLFNYSSYDHTGKAIWKLANNCGKITCLFYSIKFGTGVYLLVEGFTREVDPPMILGGAVLTTIGLVCLGSIVAIARDRFKACKRFEEIREKEELAVTKLSNYLQQTTKIEIVVDSSNSQELDLPEEVWITIFDKLLMQDVLKISRVCKKWYKMTSIPLIWGKFLKEKGLNEEMHDKEAYIQFFVRKRLEFHTAKYQKYNQLIYAAHRTFGHS